MRQSLQPRSFMLLLPNVVDQRDPGTCLFNAGGFGFSAIVEEIS